MGSRWKQVAHRYITNKQHKICHLILVVFLAYKVKFTLEKGIRRTQAKMRAGKNLQNCRNTLPATNPGRGREVLPPSKHLHTHTQFGLNFMFLWV